MKKLISAIIISLLMFGTAFAQSTRYTWMRQETATCSSLTTAKNHDLCYQTSNDTLQVCTTVSTYCQPGDWTVVKDARIGTLTEGKWCTVASGVIACTEDAPSGSMTYPGAGIALSTGSEWSASIANNSSNWNTAYGWGNHASAGYITGNQTVTLSGDATGSGTTAITVAVGDDSHSHSSSTLPVTTTYLGSSISETELAFTDVTTANATTSAHGLLPKLNNSATSYLNGQGAWTTPSGGSLSGLTANYITKATSETAVGSSLLYDTGTRIGLGVTAPDTSFHVKSATDTYSTLESTNSASYTGVSLRPTGDEWEIGAGGSASADPNKLYIYNATDDIVALSFDTDENVTFAGDITTTGDITANSVSIPGTTVTNFLGNVGIGVPSPTQKLEVDGTAVVTGFKMATGAVNGYYLKSDAAGVGSWAEVSGGSISGVTDNYITKANGTTAIENSLLYDDGTNVIIGATSGTSKFQVNTATAGITVKSDGIGTTDINGLVLRNDTASTGTGQYSPNILFLGHGWNGSVDTLSEWKIYAEPLTSSGNSKIKMAYREASGSYTTMFAVDKFGQFETPLYFASYGSRVGGALVKGAGFHNDEAATVSYNEMTPYIGFRANGWKTDATAASQYMSFGQQLSNSTGAASPIGNFLFFYGTNVSTPAVANELMRFSWGTDALVTGTKFTNRVLFTPPSAQTIAAGNTVTADACGGMKQITSAGAVTTDTTNTFTAPGANNTGCVMYVCNTGTQNITLDNNANFKSAGGADVVVTGSDCVTVVSNGTAWYQATALVAN